MKSRASGKVSSTKKVFTTIGIGGLIAIIGLVIAFLQFWNDYKDSKSGQISQETLLVIYGKQLEAQQTLVALEQNSGSQKQFQDVQATISALEVERRAIEATLTPNSSGIHPSATINSPTITISPTEEIIASLPLQENFDNGLSPAWIIQKGEPVITDGKLASSKDGLVIKLVDKLPQDYSIQMDFWMFQSSWNIILVTINDIRVVLRWESQSMESFRDNAWINLGGTKSWPLSGTFRLDVNGDKYSVFLDGNKHSEIIYKNSDNDQLSISMNSPDITLDNLILSNP